MAGQFPLEDSDEEEELSEFDYLVLDTRDIITCLYKFSIAIQNPAPKERLHKIAAIDMSHFESLDIKYIDDKFHTVDPQNNFKVAEYLSRRLGKANTRRRQLLKYYEDHHKRISQHIDDTTEGNELINESKPLNSGGGSASVPEEIKQATSIMESHTTVSTIKVELRQVVDIGKDEDQLSQTSYATSINNTIRIRVPPPPDDAVFGDEPFECPYCFNIIMIRSGEDWKYVGSYTYNFFYMLNLFLGDIYLEIFNPMFAHSPTAPKQVNYMTANESGLTMRSSFTEESGIVMPAQNLFHERHYFTSISTQAILS